MSTSIQHKVLKWIAVALEWIIGNDEGISLFTEQGLQCSYSVKGTKKYIARYKESVVVASYDDNGQQVVSILNCPIQISESSMTLFRNGKPEFVASIFSQWGSLFILTRCRTVFLLQEKDLRTKLKSLYEKHQYKTALTVAQANGMDYNGILDIHRMYALQGSFIVDMVIIYMMKTRVKKPWMSGVSSIDWFVDTSRRSVSSSHRMWFASSWMLSACLNWPRIWRRYISKASRIVSIPHCWSTVTPS